MSWFCSEVYKNISSNTAGYWKPCCIGKRVNDMKLEDTKFLDFFNSEELNQLRKDQEEGNFSELVKKTCGKCISDEANGVVSRRQYSNVKYQGRFRQQSPRGACHLLTIEQDRDLQQAVQPAYPYQHPERQTE